MFSKRLFLCLLAGLLLTLAGAEVSLAFEYAGQAWCCDTVYYWVNPTNPSLVCGGAVAGKWFRGVVNLAANLWNAQGTRFKLVNVDSTDRVCTPSGSVCVGIKDGQNTISMATSCSWTDNNVIAYSTWWYWTGGDSAYCMYESDICFNNNIRWFNNFQTCSGSCYDLFSLALHELGHWIASNHEPDNVVLGYKPVMFPSYNFCEMRRVVTVDDSALLHWAYDPVGVIALPARANVVHYHPPYPTPPTHTPCFICPPGPPFCDSVTTDPCLLICPKSDVVFKVTVKDSCGNLICDPQGTFLDFSQCPARPCPNEESAWPVVFPDSCRNGVHYFTADASLTQCTGCEARLFVNGQLCRLIQARFFDTNGDLCVKPVDWVRGGICSDYNCNFASDPADSLIWAGHLNHCCPATCDCRPGDANGDASVDISDAVYLVAYIFGGGPTPIPYAICSGDANCDCTVDISDAVFLIAYIFGGGPAPCDCNQWLINCGPPLR